MRLLEEENIIEPNKHNVLKKIIIISIIIFTILGIGISLLLFYMLKNPQENGIYIDGDIISDLENILDKQKDENGKFKIYIPIKEFANLTNSSLKYVGYTGDYNPQTEEDSKCYVKKENNEVAIFTKDSNIIYKLNLQSKSGEYERYMIDSQVYERNGKLYTGIDGIEKGFNVLISYDEENIEKIKIRSIDSLVKEYEKKLENMSSGAYGKLRAETSTLNNAKTVLQNLLIVQAENNKYGIVQANNLSKFILEPKYDSISYICESESFLVSSNKKYGIASKEGKIKINLLYDEIVSMGQDYNLYIVNIDNKFGVVDENGKVIIHVENEKIGIDISPFTYNNVKNGYILLNKLIPVQKNELWALYDMDGNLLTNKENYYKSLGYANTKGENNTYSLLEIPECNVIIVQDSKDKYSFVNIKGDDTILPFVFDSIYLKVIDGEKKYLMQSNQKEYDVIETLKRKSDK